MGDKGLERCVGCGGVLAVIGVRHLCSGHLLQPHGLKGTEPSERALVKKGTISRERAKTVKRTKVMERKPDGSERTVTPERLAVIDEPAQVKPEGDPVKDVKAETLRAQIAAQVACPVCEARRQKEAKKKQRQRIKKTIPRRR